MAQPSPPAGPYTGAPISPGARPGGGRRILIGCLIAFGAVLLLGIGACVAFGVWIRTPSTPLEGNRLANAETALYAEIKLRSEDPVAKELLRSILASTQQPEIPDDANVPEAVRWIVGSVPQRRASDREIARMLPIILVETRQAEASGGAAPPLFTVSFPRAGNTIRLADLAFSIIAPRTRSGPKMERYRDEEIYRLSEKDSPLAWVSIVRSDVLIARDLDVVRSGIDRMAAAPGAADALLAERPADAVLFFAARAGHGGALAELVEVAAPAFGQALRPLVEGAGDTILWARLRTPDVLAGEIRVKEGTRGSDRAGDGWSGTITVPLTEGEVTFSIAPIETRAGERSAWSVEMVGLTAAARHGFAALEDLGDGRRRRHGHPHAPGGAPEEEEPGRPGERSPEEPPPAPEPSGVN